MPSFSINDLLAGFMDLGHAQPAFENQAPLNVPDVEWTIINSKGRTIGLSAMLSAFLNELKPVLRRVQGNIQHTGKVPVRAGSGLLIKKQLAQLKDELKRAVELEAFERAAELRDKIKELENRKV